MKLYSLLILTENTKKSKKKITAPKKSEIVVFPGRILPCKQNKSAIFSTLHIPTHQTVRSEYSPLIGVL